MYGFSYSYRDGYKGVGAPSIILDGIYLVGRIWCVYVWGIVHEIYHGSMWIQWIVLCG